MNNIAVLLGFSENFNNSLYVAQATISAPGTIEMKRRKLKATHLEKTVFGDAGGSSLNHVVSLDLGEAVRESDGKAVWRRVGALNCWEHIQPLLKYHTYLQTEEIHVAAWPPVDPHPEGDALWGMGREGVQTSPKPTQWNPRPSSCTAQPSSLKPVSTPCKTADSPMFNKPGSSSSAVFSPDGRRLTKVLPDSEEGIIYADLDMDLILKSECFVDSCGHYSRPDLLWLGVDDRERTHKAVVHEGAGNS
ncbi:hypothetical protein LTR08_003052 [Meristemomyces frigidus]|nr:hypothetical protein LTR08_003052 [Meristemomyces frigidus]